MTVWKERGGISLGKAIEAAYLRGEDDYHMPPLVALDAAGKPVGKVQDGDTVIFCCRRGEREIELTEMFTEKDFAYVERAWRDDLTFVLLTLYHEKFQHLPVAFAPEQLEHTLAQTVSEAGKTQFHCAESEKFAHITFFLNGGNHQPFPGETDVRIPSPKGIAFEEKPELSLYEVKDEVIKALGNYDLIAVNFANGDVIGHTANNQAKIDAAFHVSHCLSEVVEKASQAGYVTMVTADHGNLERMISPKGKPDVAHTCNQVPFVLIDPEQKKPVALKDGQALASVAPTILQMMGIPAPEEMDAPSLLLEAPETTDRKVMLIVLDGWGMGAEDETNPIYLGNTEAWEKLFDSHPHTLLNASGLYVGLSAKKAGNSEAGHMNLGAGRIVPQDDQRLEKAIQEGTYESNKVFLKAIEDTRKRGKALHLLSYLTHQSSHGSIDYAVKLCAMAKELPEIYLHIILDGRSTENGSAPQLLAELEQELNGIGAGLIVDGIGRGYVLERDLNYWKVKKGYDAMVLGEGTPYQLNEE